MRSAFVLFLIVLTLCVLLVFGTDVLQRDIMATRARETARLSFEIRKDAVAALFPQSLELILEIAFVVHDLFPSG